MIQIEKTEYYEGNSAKIPEDQKTLSVTKKNPLKIKGFFSTRQNSLYLIFFQIFI